MVRVDDDVPPAAAVVAIAPAFYWFMEFCWLIRLNL